MAVSVKGCRESEYLGDCHASLCAHTGHALGEVDQVRLCRRTVLREDIHRGAYRQHCVFGAEYLLHAEDVGEFGDDLGCSLAQVDERHIDDVGGLHVALHALTGVLAQASRLLRQLVQLVPSGSGVHSLESVVHRVHLVTRHAGVFDGVGDFLLHLGVGVHRLATRHDQAGEQGRDAHERGLPVVQLSVEASPERLLRAEFGIDFGEFRTHPLYFGDMGVPCRAASLHVFQLLVQGLQRLVQLFRCGLV